MLARAGAQYDIVFRQPNQLPGGASQGVLAVLDGPRLFTGYSPASKGTTIAQSRVQLTGPGPTTVIPEPHVAGPQRQTVYGTADAAGQAWVETTSTDLEHLDWHVFYHSNGSASRLAGDSATAFPGQRIYLPVGANPVTLTNAAIVWSSSDIRKGGKTVASDLMAASRTPGGRPRVLVRNASLPAAVGPDLFFVATGQLLPATYTTSYQIERLSSDGRRSVVSSGTNPGPGRVVELSASADYVAWTWAPADETVAATISVLDRRTGAVAAVTLAPQNWSGALSLAGAHLVWGNGSSNGEGGEYLLDLARHRLWRLDSSVGYSVAFAAGRNVIWAHQAGGKITMIATRWR